MVFRFNHFVAVVVTAAAVTGLAACSSGKRPATSASPSPVDTGPVVDSAPYWCDFVPREALARITGTVAGLHEVRDRVDNPENGLCGVNGKASDPLGVGWDLEKGRYSFNVLRHNTSPNPQTPIPASLGKGFFTVDNDLPGGEPYIIIAVFHCNHYESNISISVSNVVKGRDPFKDLTDLMRIAEKRFGEIHKCTPRP